MAKGVFPRIVNDQIIEIANSPIIIVGIATLDGVDYAAMVNMDKRNQITETYEGYINIIKMNATRTSFIDNLVIYNEEEWTIISEFFDKSGVFEMNRIERWVWARMGNYSLVPKWMYDEADKKRQKIVGTKRNYKIKQNTPKQEDKFEIKWKGNEDSKSTKV